MKDKGLCRNKKNSWGRWWALYLFSSFHPFSLESSEKRERERERRRRHRIASSSMALRLRSSNVDDDDDDGGGGGDDEDGFKEEANVRFGI